MYEIQANKFNPWVVKEEKRKFFMKELSNYYKSLCMNAFGWKFPPKYRLSRWFFERNTIPGYDKYDSVFPALVEPVISSSLYKEIEEDLPAKMTNLRFVLTLESAKKYVDEYIENTEHFFNVCPEVKKTHSSSQKYKEIMDILRNLKRYLKRQEDLGLQEETCTEEKLCEWKKVVENDIALCHSILSLLAKPLIFDIVYKVAERSDEIAKRLSEISLESKNVIQKKENTWDRIHTDVLLKGGSEKFEIPNSVFQKLWKAYEKKRKGNEKNPQYPPFIEILYCLFLRYQTYSGGTTGKGSTLHAALPKEVFDYLQSAFGANHECFASPFNSIYPNYNSVFLDIDSFFGSSGSFFQYESFDQECYEANPPFSEIVFERMYERIHYALTTKNHPLTFIVIVPNWTHPPPLGIENLKKSKYMDSFLLFHAKEHFYVLGDQQGERVIFHPPTETLVIFIQKELGKNKNPITKEKKDTLFHLWSTIPKK